MRLENLYPNFGTASPEDQAAYISVYRLRRAEDLAKLSTYKKRQSSISSKPELTEEEKVVMRMLGLKQKDILALRASLEVEEESDNGIELFADSTFEGEEE